MPDMTFVRNWFGRYWLAVWFATIFVMRARVVVTGELGFDARLYLAATRAWLAGQDPWLAIEQQQFAAPPPTLLPLVPITWLPDSIGIGLMVVLSGLAVVATIRLLHLPWWWLLFPPFLDSVANGNPQSFLVPLILIGGGPIAAFLKIYAIIPIALTLRWRALLVTLALLVVTAPLLPWATYIDRFGELTVAFARQTDGGLSATAVPWLIPVAIIALALAGREKAAWLAVPVLWPTTQWYYSTLAVPALTTSMLAAAFVAVPIPGATVVAAVIVAWQARPFSFSRLRDAWVPVGILGRP